MRSHGRILAAGAATIVIGGAAACGSGGSGLDEDGEEHACEVGGQLIAAVASGDEEAADEALDGLFRIDGADDSDLDLDEIEDVAAELDEDAAEALVDEFDAIDCGLDPDDIEIAAPPDTDPEDPETTADSEPGPTEPDTSDAPDPDGGDDDEGDDDDSGGSDAEPRENIAVDVDAEPIPDGVEHGPPISPKDVVADYDLQGLLYPDTDDAQLIDIYVDVRSDLVRRTDQLTLAIATDNDMDGVLDAFRNDAEQLGDYEFTDRSETQDGVESVSFEALPADFDQPLPLLDVTITGLDGALQIDVRSIDSDYSGAADPPDAVADVLEDIVAITDAAGFDRTGWTYSFSVSPSGAERAYEQYVHTFTTPDDDFEANADAIDAEFGEVVDRQDESNYTTFGAAGASWQLFDTGGGQARIDDV